MRGFVVRERIGDGAHSARAWDGRAIDTRGAMLRQYREPRTLAGWEKSVSHEAES
ncbi:hypothetical protein D3C80_2167490 [compost metagenome]